MVHTASCHVGRHRCNSSSEAARYPERHTPSAGQVAVLLTVLLSLQNKVFE